MSILSDTANLLVLAALSVTVATPTKASDQPVCMETAEMEAALFDWYGEQPVRQIDSTSTIWASENGETWTAVGHRSDGQSCVLGKGDNWLPDETEVQLLAQLA